MDTKSNIPPQKIVNTIDVFHLKERGYGPDGLYSREQWRKECWVNLHAGATKFKSWQETWISAEKALGRLERFGYKNLSSNTDEDIGEDSRIFRSTLDFIGCFFEKNIYFDNYEFIAPVKFNDAVFNGEVGFEFSTFKNYASFKCAAFQGYTRFDRVGFEAVVNFSNAVFGNSISFSNSAFGKLTEFKNAKFKKNVDFTYSTFQLNADFKSAVFEDVAKFVGLQINGSVDFKNTSFHGVTDFSRARFSSDLLCVTSDFSEAQFNDSICFVSSVFNGYADFSICKFNKSVDFRSSTFKSHANFTFATFKKFSDFSHAVKIHGDAYFGSAVFNELTDFSTITFYKEAIFSNVLFENGAIFIDSIFYENANFKASKLQGDAIFKSTTFYANVDFSRVIFFQQCRFENSYSELKRVWSKETSFAGVVDFENAVFKNVGHFERVKFLKNIPTFRGCQIDSTRLEFSDDSYFLKHENNDDAVKNISFLKRLADEHGQIDQALNFNAMELRAKALLPNTGFWFKCFTLVYEKISDFGRSFTKPLKYYFGLLLVVYILALGNAVVNSPKNCNAENLRMLSDLWRDDTPCDISKTNPDDKTRLNGYRAAAEYTVYRAAGILDFSDNGKGTDAVARRLFGQSYEPGWMRLVGLIKAIASAALLFLAALGLRNKYRIK